MSNWKERANKKKVSCFCLFRRGSYEAMGEGVVSWIRVEACCKVVGKYWATDSKGVKMCTLLGVNGEGGGVF